MTRRIATELREFKKLNQMCDFIVANSHLLEEGSVAANAVGEIVQTVTHLKDQTARQTSAESHLRELSRLKREARAALGEEVELLYHAARSAAAESPGFDDFFRTNLRSDSKLLNAARSAVRDAAPLAETFIRHGMPADFLQKLSGAMQRFEQAMEGRSNARTAKRVGRKSLKAALRRAVAAGKRFDSIMRNAFRADRITLEAWKVACKVPRGASKGPEPSPPEPSGPVGVDTPGERPTALETAASEPEAGQEAA